MPEEPGLVSHARPAWRCEHGTRSMAPGVPKLELGNKEGPASSRGAVGFELRQQSVLADASGTVAVPGVRTDGVENPHRRVQC